MPQPQIQEGLISVVMSTYNRLPTYLEESIESILYQTYSNFEFIIVDDGSDNGTTELIRSYNDPRIRLIVNEKNIGLTNSLNKGLEVCKGEYVARMDDDDIAYPTRFEKQLDYMRKHPDVIVCGTWVEFIDQDGNLTGIVPHDYIEDMESYRISLLFGNHPTIYHPSAFFNRRLIIKHNLRYEPEYNNAEDYRLWVQCTTIGHCAILPEVLLKYRRHSNSISFAKIKQQRKVDYAIIQKQLDVLHLVIPNELMPLHYRFFSNNYELQKLYSIQLKNWLKTIIKANGRYKVYNQKKLKKMIWNRWRIICQLAVKERPRLKKSVSIILSMTPRGFLYSLKSIGGKICKRNDNK